MTTASYLQHGPRVAIRHIRRDDYEELTALRRASTDLLQRWLGAREQSEAAFCDYVARFELPTHEGLVICLRSTGAIVGGVNINNIVLGGLQCGTLGYTAYMSTAGRGYMTEGLRLALQHAFDTLGLHRLEANIQPDNVPSLKLVKWLGFQ